MEAKWTATLNDKVSSKLDNIANKVGNVDRKFNSLDNTLGKVAIGGGLLAAAGMAKDFGLSIVESLRNYEKFSAGLRVLMGGDKNAAEALNNQLVNLAKTTPFELKDVQEGSRQLLAYGFEAGGVTKNLKMLGDVSSAVGAPLNDIVYLYGTLKTQGRAYQKDINQFTGRGIPIIRELAKQFGVSESKVQDLVKAGKVGFPQIEQAFKSLTEKGGQFFGMMDEQSKTVDGKIANMADAWEQLKISIGKSQSGIIGSTTQMVTRIIEQITRGNEAANELESGRAKSGLAPRSWLDKISTGLMGRNSITSETALNSMLFEKFQNVSATNSAIQLNSFKSVLLNLKSQQYKDFSAGVKNKDLNAQDIANSNISVIDNYLRKVMGSLNLLSSQGKKPTDKNGGGDGEGDGLPTEYRGEKPQAINININEVNGIKTATITDAKQTTTEAKESLSNALLEVIDDINKIVRNR